MRYRVRNVKLKLVLLSAIIVSLGGFIGYQLSKGSSTDLADWPRAEMVRRHLDGVWTRVGRENFYPVGVMLGNMADGRPQSGLERANLVWEAPAEAGITRFLAVFTDYSDIGELGPIRSARPYYLDWAGELAALYVHVGGSPEALRLIEKQAIKNLNEFYEGQYFWRARQRLAPFNVYTSAELLASALQNKKISPQGNFAQWKFKEDAETASRPTVSPKLAIEFSKVYSPLYLVEWHYDRASNQYSRFQNKSPHQAAGGEQIKAKNIVLQYTTIEIIDEIGRRKIKTLGEGKAVVFQDGKVIQGTWKKESKTERTRVYDENGREIAFNAGSTWTEVVSPDMAIEY